MEARTYEDNVEEYVVKRREGVVLCPYSILKTDALPSMHLKRLVPRLSGAPNYRKIESSNIFAVAQPSLVGFRAVCAEFLRNSA